MATHVADPESDLQELLGRLEERERLMGAVCLARNYTTIAHFRQRLQGELLDVLTETQAKYRSRGVQLKWNLEDFLGGGREITIEIAVRGLKLVMRGTVTSEALAFSEERYIDRLSGEQQSGKLLRLRNLTPEVFRQFILNRITSVVQAVIRMTETH